MLKTMDGKELAVTELAWDEVVNEITQTNLNLAKVMEVLNDGSDYKFYKASYRFGDKIINNGSCYLPLVDGGTVDFDDPSLPERLREDLSYKLEKEDPLGLVLSKTSEFYLSGDDGIQSHSLIYPGNMFGIPKAIEEDASETSTSVLELNLNAGARSLFMLTKISDKNHHLRLQRHYGINVPTPISPNEHWNLFVEIAGKAKSPWRCEIIYFPRPWINQLKNDEWALLAKRLLSLHRASYTLRHRVSGAWEKAFREIEQQKNLTELYPQSLDFARQLFALAANMIPGFKPAVNDDSAPISLLNQVYNEIYNKIDERKNSAVIMEPTKLNRGDGHPIYYSINYSTTTKSYADSSSSKRSQIGLLDEIRRVVDYYLSAILENDGSISFLDNVAKNTVFSFYHTDPEGYPKINSIKLLPDEDLRFVENQPGDFPSSSSFFKGCIKISHKEAE